MKEAFAALPTFGVFAFAVVAAVLAVAFDRKVSRKAAVTSAPAPGPSESVASVHGRSAAGVVASGMASGVEIVAELSRDPEAALALAARTDSADSLERAILALAKSGDSCTALAYCPLADEGDALVLAFGRRAVAFGRPSGPVVVEANRRCALWTGPKGTIVLSVAGEAHVGPLPLWAGAQAQAVSRLVRLDASSAATAMRLRAVRRSFA